MLLTVATFSLAGMGLAPTHRTIIDAPLAFLAAFCVLAAAIVTDSARDKLSLDWIARLTFLGGGYLCFCVVVAGMTFIIPSLYEAKLALPGELRWHKHQLFFALAGLSVLPKLMSHRDRQSWTAGMLIFYGLSIYALLP
jgi:hypothetical protein